VGTIKYGREAESKETQYSHRGPDNPREKRKVAIIINHLRVRVFLPARPLCPLIPVLSGVPEHSPCDLLPGAGLRTTMQAIGPATQWLVQVATILDEMKDLWFILG
jgi:hypothetical protein